MNVECSKHQILSVNNNKLLIIIIKAIGSSITFKSMMARRMSHSHACFTRVLCDGISRSQIKSTTKMTSQNEIVIDVERYRLPTLA